MRLYSITPDLERYLSVCETAASAAARPTPTEADFMPGPKAPGWRPVALEWAIDAGDVVADVPDIAHYGAGEFAVRASVADLLRPALANCAEFLPATFDGDPWFIINVTNAQPIFDADNSQRRLRANGKPSRMFTRLVLRPEAIGEGRLFYAPGLAGYTFTTDQAGSLLQLVEQHGLSGLKFTPYQPA